MAIAFSELTPGWICDAPLGHIGTAAEPEQEGAFTLQPL
jgi:hypothetical protein